MFPSIRSELLRQSRLVEFRQLPGRKIRCRARGRKAKAEAGRIFRPAPALEAQKAETPAYSFSKNSHAEHEM